LSERTEIRNAVPAETPGALQAETAGAVQAETAGTVSEEWTPRIIAFLCNWCSYAGADLAGTSRIQYPPSIRVIRVPCSGRVNPQYIIKALADGADGVMVSGCHPGDCHYLEGNYYARRRFSVLKRLLSLAGFHPDRVQFTWVSASEGAKFADVVATVTEKVRVLGPSKVRASKHWESDSRAAGPGDSEQSERKEGE